MIFCRRPVYACPSDPLTFLVFCNVHCRGHCRYFSPGRVWGFPFSLVLSRYFYLHTPCQLVRKYQVDPHCLCQAGRFVRVQRLWGREWQLQPSYVSILSRLLPDFSQCLCKTKRWSIIMALLAVIKRRRLIKLEFSPPPDPLLDICCWSYVAWIEVPWSEETFDKGELLFTDILIHFIWDRALCWFQIPGLGERCPMKSSSLFAIEIVSTLAVSAMGPQ